MPPVIALLTDFGLDDPYVGQMKAVLAGLAPGVAVLDVSHGVRPHDVRQAGFFCRASAPHLPPGSIVACVVDPGVGSGRRLVLLRWRGRTLLAPDNGLLSLFLDGSGLEAFDVTPDAPPAGATFHGRDVLAPLAARLAGGATPESLGAGLPVAALHRLDWAAPRLEGARLVAQALHADRFGNVILNLAVEPWAMRLPPGARLAMDAPRFVPVCVARCYADLPAGAPGLLAGSQGFMELAIRQASAARLLGLEPGQEVAFNLEGAGA